MRVVIDTNVLLMALPARSPYHKIIQAFNNRAYQLIITTSVVLEYEEIFIREANPFIANIFLSALREAPNAEAVETYYHWELITTDTDDNKFIDAYLNGEADYLVTNDNHFNVVRDIKFPKINLVSASEFLQILENRI